ncbi:MAG: MBOAT family protein, partial [Firmicutes bacterium]|nr:MBOAT family protein [Bacillota bacterium]
MVFSSAIFLFVFFPTVFILYNVAPSLKIKNLLLTAASLIFYSFGQPEYLILLLASVVINYISGYLLCGSSANRKAVLAVSVVLNLGILSVFKYLDFAIHNINSLFGAGIPMAGIVLPIGISFFTFQGMSYVIDVYRDPSLGTKNFAKLLLYISFFPQLIAGPIVKYHDVAAMIDDRKCSMEMTAKGLRRFILGLTKKLLFANAMGAIADQVFSLSAEGLDARIAWIGAVCYSLQIYFDFSGYSDMAIGMGKIFGFTFLENFDHPYVASTIQDFWRRWHISLSSWFRDYLYIPLGGSYCSKGRAAFNKIVVFFTTGLWHGANWTFIVWGMWHGLFSMLETMGIIPAKKLQNRFLGHVYTLMVVMLGFVLFRADTFAQAGLIFKNMFTGFTFTPATNQILHDLL